MKKKINNDIKAAITLIIAEDLVALRNVIRTIIKSASKSLSIKGGSIFQAIRKKRNAAKRRMISKKSEPQKFIDSDSLN